MSAISASVGQLPFNFAFATDNDAFQIGGQAPKLKPPATPEGELEVRLDGCEGKPVAVLPLAPAVSNPAVTTLPGRLAGKRFGPSRPLLHLHRPQRRSAVGGGEGAPADGEAARRRRAGGRMRRLFDRGG